jgi:protein involved in polysaccharide export with SLBB domain
MSAIGTTGLLVCLAMIVPAVPALSQSSQDQSLALNEPSQYFDKIYRDFYTSYRLGPADEIAIRVVGQPDYSLERVKISPVGQIYHPLIGDMDVVGFTVDGLARKLTSDFSTYIINPKVSVALLSAQSAKVGVLGEVLKPGIVVMAEPMTVLDVITAAGGVSDSAGKSEITLLRQTSDGRLHTVPINLKRILQAKAEPDENLTLRAGDTLIVHTNTRKKITTIMGMAGFAQFLTFLTLTR